MPSKFAKGNFTLLIPRRGGAKYHNRNHKVVILNNRFYAHFTWTSGPQQELANLFFCLMLTKRQDVHVIFIILRHAKPIELHGKVPFSKLSGPTSNVKANVKVVKSQH